MNKILTKLAFAADTHRLASEMNPRLSNCCPAHLWQIEVELRYCCFILDHRIKLYHRGLPYPVYNSPLISLSKSPYFKPFHNHNLTCLCTYGF